jgi:hypothetical protein
LEPEPRHANWASALLRTSFWVRDTLSCSLPSPHLNPTAFLSSTGVWNLEWHFPLSSSRPFRGSFLPFSRSSSSSRHRRRLLTLFPSPFSASQELPVSHFVVLLPSSCASTVSSSVRRRLRSRIPGISSWSTFTCYRAFSHFLYRFRVFERASYRSSHTRANWARLHKAHPLPSSVYLEFCDSNQQVLQSQLSCFATLISHLARLFSTPSVQLRFNFFLSELFYNV